MSQEKSFEATARVAQVKRLNLDEATLLKSKLRPVLYFPPTGRIVLLSSVKDQLGGEPLTDEHHSTGQKYQGSSRLREQR